MGSTSNTVSENVQNFIISVNATNAVASESGSIKGAFTISSNVAVPANTLVNFAIGGTATSGTDYQPLPTSVTILAGETSATVLVTGIPNGQYKGDQSVVLNLTSSPSYPLGTASAIVTILEGDTLAFLSNPTANPNPAQVGQLVQFNCLSNGSGALYIWDFGDGVMDNSGSASVSHTYSAPISATVKVTVKMPNNTQALAQFTMVVTAGQQSGGCGFRQRRRIRCAGMALGTDPYNAMSVPVSNAGAPLNLNVVKMTISENFRTLGHDLITANGYLPVTPGFAFLNQKVAVDVGGVTYGFTLTAKGKGVNGSSYITIATKPNQGQSKFTLRLGTGAFQSFLTDEHLTNVTVKNLATTVAVKIIFNNTLLHENAAAALHFKDQCVRQDSVTGSAGLPRRHDHEIAVETESGSV